MKWFLIFLALSLSACEKLDRTYLPPPGAQFAGGIPGDIQAPFAVPNLPQRGNIPIVPGLNGFNEFGTVGQPSEFPVTTTSYAFTQTTTFPFIESYETTAVPINPVTGLQILGQNGYQQYSNNLPGFNQNQSQGVPYYGVTVQPGSTNKLLNQDIITPGGVIQTPSSDLSGFNQAFAQHGLPDHQISNQNTGQNLIIPGTDTGFPGSISQVPENNQILIQYPNDKNTPTSEYGVTAFQKLPPGQVPQGTFPGQPIIVPDARLPLYNQNYQNQDQPVLQQSSENQNEISPGSNIGQKKYYPNQVLDGVSSRVFPSSASAHASIDDISRPERPQAAVDRNAVIVNYENVRTPNGYSYRYDTSNGIHADEIGTVDDGTRARGSYSYTGDDGKVYSVTYTADENGFQPHGDHLPTAPPIPEAIKEVIEQAARDREAGIIDDGSYDDVKYGHSRYQSPITHHRLQIKDRNVIKNNKIGEGQEKIIRPITEIAKDDYYESKPQDQFTSNIGNDNNIPNKKYTTGGPINKITDVNERIGNVSGGSKKAVDKEDDDILTGLNDNDKNHFDLKNQDSFAQISDTNFKNSPNQEDFNQRNIESKDVSQIDTEYPGLQIEDIKESDTYPDNENDFKSESDKIFSQSRPGQVSAVQNNGFPAISNRRRNEQKLKNRRPTSANKYIKEKRPQSDEIFNQGSVDDYDRIHQDTLAFVDNDQNNVNHLPSRQENIQQSEQSGYYYQPPQTQLVRTQFPTRFYDKENDLTTKPKMFGKGTTVRPFVTSEVHNQPTGIKQDVTHQEHILQPFMTSSVTTTKYSSRTDYDDGDNQDIEEGTRKPSKEIGLSTRRRLQPTQTTARPQYIPFGQRIRVSEEESVPPSQKIDYSLTPSYSHGSSNPVPSQNARSESTQISRKPVQSRQPILAVPDSSSINDKPTSLLKSGYETSVTRPAPGYPGTTVMPSSITEAQPSYGFRFSPEQRNSTLQSYPPASTTTIPTTSRYQIGLGVVKPGTPVITQPSPDTDYHNGYRYEPVRSKYTTTAKPQVNFKQTDRPVTKTFFPGVSTRGYYPTTEPNDYFIGRQGIKIEPKTTDFAPIDASQTGYHYGPPRIVSNDGAPFSTASPGSYLSQTSPTNYKHLGPVYSTTISPSSIGTTPASLISSTIPEHPDQMYSTTQPPNYFTTQNIYNQNPLVDGFGRPVDSEPHTRFFSTSHDSNEYPRTHLTVGEDRRPLAELSTEPNSQGGIPTNNLSPRYPDYNDQTKVIGEDFSGPKQAQRYDPQTGYHYK